MITQFVAGLSIIVGLHEFGHLLFAKLFGMRVESYCIGFPPKLFKFKIGETEYSLGIIPLGGAVKISGMIDEYLDDTGNTNAPNSWEFRAKPAWQRMVVMLGGIFFNVLTGLVIYSAISFHNGDVYLSKDELNKYGILPGSVGADLGFIEGDKLIGINGHDFSRLDEVLAIKNIGLKNGYYTILRDGCEVTIAIPSNFIEKISAVKEYSSFITPKLPFVVGNVFENSPAFIAGLKTGDCILEVNEIPTLYVHNLKGVIQSNIGNLIKIKCKRNDNIIYLSANVNNQGELGFEIIPTIKYEKKQYNVFQAVVAGVKRAFDIAYANIIGLIKVITGKISVTKSLSGPIGIAQIFGKCFDWINFWNIVGLLSMVLAITNLLPIPALDGGHVLLILCEIITGKRLPERFLIVSQKIGMVILLMLIVFTMILDIYKLF